MSALGHKQTYAVQERISALPPIATAKADSRKRSCLLYPQKRTCAVQTGMSALGQKRTSKHLTGLVALLRSFDLLSTERGDSRDQRSRDVRLSPTGAYKRVPPAQ